MPQGVVLVRAGDAWPQEPSDQKAEQTGAGLRRCKGKMRCKYVVDVQDCTVGRQESVDCTVSRDSVMEVCTVQFCIVGQDEDIRMHACRGEADGSSSTAFTVQYYRTVFTAQYLAHSIPAQHLSLIPHPDPYYLSSHSRIPARRAAGAAQWKWLMTDAVNTYIKSQFGRSSQSGKCSGATVNMSVLM